MSEIAGPTHETHSIWVRYHAHLYCADSSVIYPYKVSTRPSLSFHWFKPCDHAQLRLLWLVISCEHHKTTNVDTAPYAQRYFLKVVLHFLIFSLQGDLEDSCHTVWLGPSLLWLKARVVHQVMTTFCQELLHNSPFFFLHNSCMSKNFYNIALDTLIDYHNNT